MVYTFHNVEIDEDGFAIRRAGAVVEVEPRVLEFLIYLVRNRRRMVSKAELLERLWGGCAVSRTVVARCACIARQTVGDASAIRTIRARGYQWVGPVVAEANANGAT
jgi:DNA-binding winged helix-turn-helix (wHTH) protein